MRPLIPEQDIASMGAPEQLALARSCTSESAVDRVQLGRCLLVMHEARSYLVCGFRSVLHLELGVEPEVLRQCLRITLLVRRLPLICNAVGEGELTWPKLVTLVRQAHPDTEGFWLEQARQVGDSELEKMVETELEKGRLVYQEEWLDLKRHLPITEFEDDLQRAVWETFVPPMSDRDCLLLFGLLHSCKIEYGGYTWELETLRGAASHIASIWRGTDLKRADYCYWYNQFQDAPVPFARLVGDDLRRLHEIRDSLLSHPLIGNIVPEVETGYPYDWPRG